MTPLNGLKVVELGIMIAVPMATQMLAGLGAEVIKVEDTVGGDPLRSYGSSRGGLSTWFANSNTGKRSIAVDLNTEAGKSILWQLLEEADVLVQGFRTGVLDRLGFDYETVHARLPALVYCSSTGFGESGPYADLPAYDPIIQALSGWAGLQEVDGKPTLHKAMVSDKTAAMFNSQAILAALLQRHQTGQGCYIEASMLESNILFNWTDGMMHCSLLEEDANHLPNLCQTYRLYECTDGYITLAIGSDKQWQSFCRTFGADAEANDERLLTAVTRSANIAHFYDTQARIVASHSVARVVESLRAADVPVAPVHKPADVIDDPQLLARGFVEASNHPRMGRYLSPKQPISMFGQDISLSPAPVPGEQTREILEELGYEKARIDTLVADSVVISSD